MSPGFPCCCPTGECTCLCEISIDGFAPCCWEVVLAGVVDDSCTDCEVLNKTYYLAQTDKPGTADPEGCSWLEPSICGSCDPGTTNNVWLTAFEDAGDFIIEVDLGGVIFQKNYGTTKPDMCSLSGEVLTKQAGSTDCDYSSATLTITATNDDHPCVTDSCFVDCIFCTDFPEEFAVDIGVGGWKDNGCDFCDQVAGVVVTQGFFSCTTLSVDPNVCGLHALIVRVILITSANPIVHYQVNVELVRNAFDQRVTVYESATWNRQEEGDCLFLADEDGKISVSRISSTDTGFSACTSTAIDPLPSTIEIWDANA